ncbi:hypothetical protein ACIQFZ_18115 [Streptomyces sp. NPDC093064]|uniref:hypothetical protein n=1 Tax=Streptomyces sp. NPDC093064 TaxID=3366020 RepID=UPI00380BD400
MTRRSRGWLAAGTVAVVLLTSGGCLGHSDDKWKEPTNGQTEVLLNAEAGHTGSAGSAWLGFDGAPDGLAAGPDGRVYGLSASLVVIEKDHKAKSILDDEVHGAGGLIVQSENSFVVGKGGQVLRMQADGRSFVLAGAPGKSRKLGQPVPETAAAKEYHFSDYLPHPFGTRPDGSILFSEGDVIWQLKAGRLTRAYQVPRERNAPGKSGRAVIGDGSAVDQSGTVFARISADQTSEKLGEVVAIHQDGSTAKLSFPPRITGVTEEPAALDVTWMTGDDGNGVYVRAAGHSADYVFHMASGKAKLVAKAPHRTSHSECREGHLVDSLKLPCPMPWAVAYSPEGLIMAGNAPFVLKVATK